MSKNLVNYKEPFEKFSQWFEMAGKNKNIIEPTAMCLSTVEENQPSSRMILLKKFDERGFCFFTNLTSTKAKQLEKNPNVALCFYWGVLGKQVRIEGTTHEVDPYEADEYFASRRRGSQVGAWASKQSQEMASWEEFETRIQEVEKKFFKQEIPRPAFWSGFRVVPTKIEFWQEGEFRIHQREVYEKSGNGWKVKKVYP